MMFPVSPPSMQLGKRLGSSYLRYTIWVLASVEFPPPAHLQRFPSCTLQAQGPQEPPQEAPCQVCAGSGAPQGPGAGRQAGARQRTGLRGRGNRNQGTRGKEHAAGVGACSWLAWLLCVWPVSGGLALWLLGNKAIGYATPGRCLGGGTCVLLLSCRMLRWLVPPVSSIQSKGIGCVGVLYCCVVSHGVVLLVEEPLLTCCVHVPRRGDIRFLCTSTVGQCCGSPL